MEVGLVQLLGPVVIAITAAALLVFLPDPDPLTTVVASITLPENVPCLPPFRLIANFRCSDGRICTRSMCNKRHLIRDIVYNFGKVKRHQLDPTQNLRDSEQNY